MYSDVHERICFKLGIMINTIENNILIVILSDNSIHNQTLHFDTSLNDLELHSGSQGCV